MGKVVSFTLEVNGFNTTISNANELKESLKAIKQVAGNTRFNSSELKQYQEAQAKLTRQQQRLREEARKQVNELKAQENTYRGLSARLNILRNNYKDLAVQERQNTKDGRKLLSTITDLDKRLKKIDASVGQFQRSVGNYSKALQGLGRGLLGAFGIASGVQLFVKGIRDAANIIKEFDQANANLASILGKSKNEIGALTDQAKQLGATTAFTATQVLELQTELAKLGFNEQEILQSAKAIEDFSIAVGTDAASAAAVGGAALRAFGLDASEIERVVSTLAVATTKSALDFRKIESALSTVAPVAKAANVSIERTTALLGVLANNGLDASTSGTSLRNIFLELAKQGITWNEAVDKINNSTDRLNTANELFGKRGATAALILAENGAAAEDLEKSLTGVNDELGNLVDERLNTVEGQLKLTRSAWEGFVLSVEDGSGVISNGVKGILEGVQGLLGGLTALNEGFSFEAIIGGLGTGVTSLKQNLDLANTTINTIEESVRKVANEAQSLDGLSITNLAKAFESAGLGADKAFEKARNLFDELNSGFVTSDADFLNVLGDINSQLEKTDEVAKTASTSFELLQDKQKELKESIIDAKLNGEDYTNSLREYNKVTKQITDATDLFNKKLKQVFEEGSIEKVQQEITEIQKRINETGDTNQLEVEIQNLIDKKAELDQLETSIANIQGRLEQGARATVDVEQISNSSSTNTVENLTSNTLESTSTVFDNDTRQLSNDINRIETIEKLSLQSQETINAAKDAYREEELQKEQEQAERINQLRSSITDAIAQASAKIFEIQKEQIEANLQRTQNSINSEYSARIEAAEGNEALQEKLRKEAAKKQEKAEKIAAEQRRAIAIKEAAIQTALGVIKAIPNPYLMAFAALSGAIQIAAIKNQQFEDGGVIFEDGGVVFPAKSGGVIQGPSHKKGGVKFRDKRGNRMEAEGGEAILNVGQQKKLKKVAGKDIFHRIGLPNANKTAMFNNGGVITGGNLNSDFAIPAAPASFVSAIKVELSKEDVNYLATEIATKNSDATRDGFTEAADALSEQSIAVEQLGADRDN